ncbi:MAG: hypothetical protein E4H03_04090 [Myxococcales bacterium]|jgi:hypothetical protein|nr:MAG: hypothetical protein E4H03_04090 [Myxococcales bacterium]
MSTQITANQTSGSKMVAAGRPGATIATSRRNSPQTRSTLLSLVFELRETTRLSTEALAQLAAEKISAGDVVLTGNYAGVTTGWL